MGAPSNRFRPSRILPLIALPPVMYYVLNYSLATVTLYTALVLVLLGTFVLGEREVVAHRTFALIILSAVIVAVPLWFVYTTDVSIFGVLVLLIAGWLLLDWVATSNNRNGPNVSQAGSDDQQVAGAVFTVHRELRVTSEPRSIEELAVRTGLEESVIEQAVETLLSDGTVQYADGGYVIDQKGAPSVRFVFYSQQWLVELLRQSSTSGQYEIEQECFRLR